MNDERPEDEKRATKPRQVRSRRAARESAIRSTPGGTPGR